MVGMDRGDHSSKQRWQGTVLVLPQHPHGGLPSTHVEWCCPSTQMEWCCPGQHPHGGVSPAPCGVNLPQCWVRTHWHSLLHWHIDPTPSPRYHGFSINGPKPKLVADTEPSLVGGPCPVPRGGEVLRVGGVYDEVLDVSPRESGAEERRWVGGIIICIINNQPRIITC